MHTPKIAPWKRKLNRGTHVRVGRAIREARQRWGVSQMYLAKFVGCNHTSISALERGRVGSLELVESVAWAMGLDLTRLRIEQPDLPTSIQTRFRAAA